MDLEVSTASRKDQPLAQTPAAVFVITREDIRRSGATSVPEALRLAPGVAVARISPSKWSVSIRGFSGRFANKLLVLIDGRTVYTPVFSGVYWEIHDLPLQEIERIEVIRGPGATLWGSNAVNGIVNIITRTAADTQGTRLDLAAGSEHLSTTARWGGAVGPGAHLRVFATARSVDGFEAADGSGDLDDGYEHRHGGFRADWVPGGIDQLTLQGDLVHLDQGQALALPAPLDPPAYARRGDDDIEVTAGSLLGRWERSLAADAEIRLQVYVDHYERREITREERVSTFDLDLQHHFAAAGRHDLVWGVGYRHAEGELESRPGLIVGRRESRTLRTLSGFIQDEIKLIENRLWLTAGTKVEHNDLTGVEWQPNVRVLWAPDGAQSLWASVARAVRTPSFGERDYRISMNVIPPLSPSPFGRNRGTLPLVRAVDGYPDFGSERLIAYELGWRRRLQPDLTCDLALFYNDYDDLLTSRIGPVEAADGYLVLPAPVSNDMKGHSWGAELTLDWRPSERWRIQPTLSLLESDFRIGDASNLDEEAREAATDFRERTDPRLQASLRAGWTPRDDLDLDLWLRHVSAAPMLGKSSGLAVPDVEAYWDLDLRVAWRPRPGMEIALIGKGLLAPGHMEGIEEIYPVPAEVPRSLLLTFKHEL